MREPLLDKLDRKMGRFAPKHLMMVFVIGTAVVWVVNYIVYLMTGLTVYSYIDFNKDAIFSGEVWRIVTFLFVSVESHPLFLVISLYFYWLLGNALERAWGAFKFDLFYLCGVLGAIGSGLITGFATVYYLNLSLFLAFAILYPNYQVLLFFFLPIKMKWIAIVDVAFIVLSLIFNDWAGRIAIFVALANVVLFVAGNLIRSFAAWRRRRKWQKAFEEGEVHVKQIRKATKKEKQNTKDEDDFFN